MTASPPIVLGIETSCDDTAVAIVTGEPEGERKILANEIWSQHQDHAAFGGVVPEIAARSHVERLDVLINRAIKSAGVQISTLDAIAVTAGPGLVGGVIVGLMTAKALAISHNIPIIPVNHLEGHALSVRLTENAPYPFLLLLVSGGHTQLIHVKALGDYTRLGTTIDDAAGEAFDKSAKLLGLAQPGGPAIEDYALNGDRHRFAFPRPLFKRAGCDFSFSGLKTALRLEAQNIAAPSKQDVADLAASFQSAIVAHLTQRTANAIDMISGAKETPDRLVIAGGVAANMTIRNGLETLCETAGYKLIVPPPKLCTDNGAMIAWAGLERFYANLSATGNPTPPDWIMDRKESLQLGAKARWPLATPPLGKAFGGGRKGPKA